MIFLGHNINFWKKTGFVGELDTPENGKFPKCQS